MGRSICLAFFTGAIALAPAAGQAGASPSDPVAAFGCTASRPAARTDMQVVVSAYSQRSIAIVRAALARDKDVLGKMVAPSASFLLFQGDVAPGSRLTGADAALEFVGGIRPADFQYSTVSTPMPSLADPCGEADANVMLTGRPGGAVLAIFKYRAGLLVEVNARRVELTRGSFPSAADR